MCNVSILSECKKTSNGTVRSKTYDSVQIYVFYILCNMHAIWLNVSYSTHSIECQGNPRNPRNPRNKRAFA